MQSEHASVARAFGEMGLSFKAVFPDPIERLPSYSQYRWIIRKSKDQYVVHAFPPADEMESTFWEKWSLLKDGAVVHRVLFSSPPTVPYHDILDLPRKVDKLFPKEIAGTRWYVVEQPDMLAWGVKNLLAVR